MRRLPSWLLVPLGLVAFVLVGGLLSPISADPILPTAYTTRVGASGCTPTSCLSRDSFGNPQDATFTISTATGGVPTSYAVCLKVTAHPTVADPAADPGNWSAYNAYRTGGTPFAYSASGSGAGSYSVCKKFSWSSGSSNSKKLSNFFAFGGPATYEVDWYAPDIPTFGSGGTITNSTYQVGSGADPLQPAQTFKWAKSDVYSPCPWDPQLQIGVWRTSRFKILNRCNVRSGTVTSGVSGPNSLDRDRSWGLASMHTEYVKRDGSGTTAFLPNPLKGSTWTIVGVLVCDLYHGHKEMHPVFQATNSGTTYLTGPQYSTVVPSVSGTWSLHSC